jgi:hypothetical protein
MVHVFWQIDEFRYLCDEKMVSFKTRERERSASASYSCVRTDIPYVIRSLPHFAFACMLPHSLNDKKGTRPSCIGCLCVCDHCDVQSTYGLQPELGLAWACVWVWERVCMVWGKEACVCIVCESTGDSVWSCVGHTYIHTYIHACMHTYMQSTRDSVWACVRHTYIHTYIHTYTQSTRDSVWASERVWEGKRVSLCASVGYLCPSKSSSHKLSLCASAVYMCATRGREKEDERGSVCVCVRERERERERGREGERMSTW